MRVVAVCAPAAVFVLTCLFVLHACLRLRWPVMRCGELELANTHWFCNCRAYLAGCWLDWQYPASGWLFAALVFGETASV